MSRYGIRNSLGLEGYLDSGAFSEIVVARGAYNYAGSTSNAGGASARFITLSNVILTKYYPIQLLRRGYNNLNYPLFTATTEGGGVLPVVINNGMYENNQQLVIKTAHIDSGTPTVYARGYMRGTAYFLVTASLAQIQQTVPQYGLILRNTAGQITFNSNHAPILYRGVADLPSVNAGAFISQYNTYQQRLPATVNPSKLPMAPCWITAVGFESNQVGRLGIVAYSNGYFNRRVIGQSGRSTYNQAAVPFPAGGGFRVPFIHATDYF